MDDWHEQPPGAQERFRSRYAGDVSGTRHEHVHGANLGVRASTYDLIGGVAGLPLAEDHALLDALERHGARIVRPPRCAWRRADGARTARPAASATICGI